MQPTEGYSVPRRALDVEDYIDICRRHKGWIFGPFLLTLVGSVVGVYFWPDSYLSTAVIRIQPQQVPASMVQPAVNQDMAERITSMSQTILSRAVLTTVINSFGLYQKERSRMTVEDLVEEMRRKIEIIPANNLVAGGGQRQVPAFAVQFSYENRFKAQQVVQDLVSRFINESIKNRSNATFLTTQFLKDQADQAHRELDEIENRLTEFRVQNNGRLPDQVDANVRQLQALQANITFLGNAISRSQQEKMQMEASVRILKDQLAQVSKEPEPAGQRQQKSERLVELERDIQGLENQLAVYRQRYTEKNPDVQTLRDRLTVAKKRREEVLKQEGEERAAEPPPVAVVDQQNLRERRDLDAQIKRTESAVAAKDLELEDYSKDLKRTNDSIKAYQARLETIPLGEKQYGDLLRDRELAKTRYVDMDVKLDKAQVAQEMESRKQGEILELLDAPSLPQNPTEPKRPLIVAIGAAVGLMLGVVLAGVREMKDSSLKNLKDVRAYTQMAILGSIPLLENDFVVRRRKRLSWLAWTTTCLAAVITMGGAVVYYYVTKV